MALICLMFKSLLPVSQQTLCLSITITAMLMLFREIICVYSEYQMIHKYGCGENAELFHYQS